MIQGITLVPPENQKLSFKEHNIMSDNEKTLFDYGLTSNLAKAQSPAEIELSFNKNGIWEDFEKAPYSSPPELPDVMKPGQETTTVQSD